MVMVSDGSGPKTGGAFGWKITATDGTRLAQGKGPAFGGYMNSYRAEAYGMLSLLLFVLHFCDQFHLDHLPDIRQGCETPVFPSTNRLFS